MFDWRSSIGRLWGSCSVALSSWFCSYGSQPYRPKWGGRGMTWHLKQLLLCPAWIINTATLASYFMVTPFWSLILNSVWNTSNWPSFRIFPTPLPKKVVRYDWRQFGCQGRLLYRNTLPCKIEIWIFRLTGNSLCYETSFLNILGTPFFIYLLLGSTWIWNWGWPTQKAIYAIPKGASQFNCLNRLAGWSFPFCCSCVRFISRTSSHHHSIISSMFPYDCFICVMLK